MALRATEWISDHWKIVLLIGLLTSVGIGSIAVRGLNLLEMQYQYTITVEPTTIRVGDQFAVSGYAPVPAPVSTVRILIDGVPNWANPFVLVDPSTGYFYTQIAANFGEGTHQVGSDFYTSVSNHVTITVLPADSPPPPPPPPPDPPPPQNSFQIQATPTTVRQWGTLTISGSVGVTTGWYVVRLLVDGATSNEMGTSIPDASGYFSKTFTVTDFFSVGSHAITADYYTSVSNTIYIVVRPPTFTITFSAMPLNSIANITIGSMMYICPAVVTLEAGSYPISVIVAQGWRFKMWSVYGMMSVDDPNAGITILTLNPIGSSGPFSGSVIASLDQSSPLALVANFAYKSAGQPDWISVTQGSSIEVVSPVAFLVQITQGTAYAARLNIDGTPYAMTTSGSNIYVASVDLPSNMAHTVRFEYQSSTGGSWGALGLLNAQSQGTGLAEIWAVLTGSIFPNWLVMSALMLILLAAAIIVVTWRRRR